MELKRKLIRLRTEFLYFLEYFIRAPFIEIASLTKGILKLIQKCFEFISKSHSNGSVTIFYALLVITILLIRKGVDTSQAIVLIIMLFVSFVWAMISLPDWKEYIKKKYYEK